MLHVALLYVAGWAHPPAQPQELQGAAKLISALNGGKPGAPPPPKELSELTAKVEAFGNTAESLAPEEAAKQWLALCDQAAPLLTINSAHPFDASTLFEALPPPAAWPELRRLVEARTAGKTNGRALCLRLLGQVLTHDLRAAASTLRQMTVAGSNGSNNFSEGLGAYIAVARATGDRALIDDAVELLVTGAKNHEQLQYELDQLPGLLGDEAASKAYERILLASPSSLDSLSDPHPRALVAKLIPDDLAKMPGPAWGIVQGLERAPLYPMFASKWPAQPIDGEPTNSQRDRASACIWYALSLELAGRHAAAVALSDKQEWLPDAYVQLTGTRSFASAPVARAFYRLMAGVYDRHPEKVLWSLTLEAARECGETAKALKLIEREVMRLSAEQRRESSLPSSYVNELLAFDQVDAAVKELRRQLDLAHREDPKGRSDSWIYGQILAIGVLTGRPALVKESLDRILKGDRGQLANFYNDEERPSSPRELVIKEGRASIVEQAYIKAIEGHVQAYKERNGRQMTTFGAGGGGFGNFMPSRYYHAELSGLADLYRRLGRPADVVALFQESPGWGEDHLSTSSPSEQPESERRGTVDELNAAWALGRTGHRALATSIMAAPVLNGSEYDPDFRLLVDLAGSGAIAILDRAHRAHPYSVRPLIWKAVALHRVHRDAEAERVVRQAIALDPSDSHAVKGQWQKAYDVLAQIQAARTNAAAGSLTERATHAAALMERGAELAQSNLDSRAAALYVAAAKLWPESAAIQVQTGRLLESLGRNREAEGHYRAAFRLLPDQLGVREPSRLDLENLLQLPLASKVAGEEFSRRLKVRPTDSRALYLQARLARVRGEETLSADRFIASAHADPTFVLAWIGVTDQLYRTGSHPDDYVRAVREALRLDPDGYIGSPMLGEDLDPAVIWSLYHAAPAPSAGVPPPTWRLAASADDLEKVPPDETQSGLYYRSRSKPRTDARSRAARAVADMELIRLLMQWLVTGIRDDAEDSPR